MIILALAVLWVNAIANCQMHQNKGAICITKPRLRSKKQKLPIPSQFFCGKFGHASKSHMQFGQAAGQKKEKKAFALWCCLWNRNQT